MSSALAAASLILKPEGYSEGRLQTLKPIEKLGSELVTNGDFATDSDWELGTGWSISGGVASVVSTADQQLRQYIPIVSGKTYRLKFDILSLQQGAFRIFFRDGGNPSYFLTDGQGSIINFSSPQSVNITFTATQDNDKMCIYPSGTTTGSVDNVSLKEVLVDGGDFTFSRGSNLAATRVGADGLIEKGRENLLLQSNSFDTTWVKNPSNVSITSGFSGYDGSNNAWKLEAVSDNNYSVVNQLVSSTGVETFSVYAKAGTSNFFRIQVTGGTNTSASYFDLSGSGSVGINFNNIDAKIESVGNGWFRCSVTGNKTTSSNCVVYVVDANGSTNVTTGANVYIQDAQLEVGLVATSYLESGAVSAKGGILETTPRLDYSGGATEPSLLLEPQRTNSATHSEYFGAWSAFRATITDNSATSPEGVPNAAVLTEDTTNNSHPLNKTFSVSSGVEYTLTIFAKQGSRRYLALLALNGGSNIYYDLQEKTAGSGGSIEDYGNGWLRLIYTYTTNSTSAELYIQPSINGSSAVYTGDGSNAVFLYGAQLEEGSYPTSYIPNHSGGSVTRGKDTGSLNMIVAGITTGWTSATLFIEYEKPNTGEGVDTFRMHGTSTNGRAYIYNTGVGFSSDWAIAGGHTLGEITKHIWRLDSLSEGTRFRNGAIENTGSGTAWSDIRYMYLNNQGLGGTLKIKQILLFPTALSNADCITLTTL